MNIFVEKNSDKHNVRSTGSQERWTKQKQSQTKDQIKNVKFIQGNKQDEHLLKREKCEGSEKDSWDVIINKNKKEHKNSVFVERNKDKIKLGKIEKRKIIQGEKYNREREKRERKSSDQLEEQSNRMASNWIEDNWTGFVTHLSQFEVISNWSVIFSSTLGNKIFSQEIKFRRGQRFGKNVSKVFNSGYMFNFNCFISNFVSNIMVFLVEMFVSLSHLRNCGNHSCRFRIHIQNHRFVVG